jgi:hypothetical protein
VRDETRFFITLRKERLLEGRKATPPFSLELDNSQPELLYSLITAGTRGETYNEWFRLASLAK